MTDPATSPEKPWPVRTVARKVADWINRLGDVWVEGQVTQISNRPGTGTAFITLRDPAADVSMTVTCPTGVLREHQPPLTDGTRVILHARPAFFIGRGTLSLRADEIRAVGIGQLLARIERLRKLLAAEGLFDPRRKRKPPFLPHTVGLITGRASAAEHDVMVNARARWPAVRFRVENVAVQGAFAVPQIVDALGALDRDKNVDVIVIARGGGSVEDLLPFSDETLLREVSGCRTPVLSAIGHEQDTPLLDHVADIRCSTPTDAGKRVVPDITEETARVRQLRDRARRALHGWVDRERHLLTALRSRPVLADPITPLEQRSAQVNMLVERSRRAMAALVTAERAALDHTRARLTTLGPAATLARGYAVVQRVDEEGNPRVLRSTAEAPDGTRLRVRVADGAVHAIASGRGDASGGSGAETGS
ncbi:exodeoxyribonuclease VII large subunit [Actinophytocola glycyrrhizae]|uniref:Exodeoxyribonuclease 7 large subunit n=1 Tax=Actinophytocola glycyrrhizae TaxID=2044873 RepID=A0ABV9RXC5_9PSEU